MSKKIVEFQKKITKLIKEDTLMVCGTAVTVMMFLSTAAFAGYMFYSDWTPVAEIPVDTVRYEPPVTSLSHMLKKDSLIPRGVYVDLEVMTKDRYMIQVSNDSIYWWCYVNGKLADGGILKHTIRKDSIFIVSESGEKDSTTYHRLNDRLYMGETCYIRR